MSSQQKPQVEQRKAHNVQIKLIDNKLNITINATNDINVSYFAQISRLSQIQDISKSFDTLDQLAEYLMHGNYQVDLANGFLEIIARVSTGKNKVIVIAKIPLTTRKPDITISLKQIQQQCLKNTNLSPTQLQTRQYLSKLSQILIQHIQQKNNQSKPSFPSQPSQQPINLQQVVKNKQQMQSVIQSKINIINDNVNRKTQQLRELMMRKMGAVDRQIEGLKAKIVESRRESRGNGDLRVLGADTDNLALEARIDFIENDISTLVDRISEMNRNIYEFARNLRQKKPKQQKTQFSQATSMPISPSMFIQSPTPLSSSPSPSDIKSWLQQKSLPESVTIGPGNTIQSKNEAVSISSKVVISRKYKYSISVRKINQIISVGIIDHKFIHAANTSGSAFLYCSDGRYYDGYQYVLPKTNVGFEFGKGDRVFVDVDLEKGEIKWSFRGEQKLCIFNQKLRNKQTKWVAFIKLSGMCSIVVFP